MISQIKEMNIGSKNTSHPLSTPRTTRTSRARAEARARPKERNQQIPNSGRAENIRTPNTPKSPMIMLEEKITETAAAVGSNTSLNDDGRDEEVVYMKKKSEFQKLKEDLQEKQISMVKAYSNLKELHGIMLLNGQKVEHLEPELTLYNTSGWEVRELNQLTSNADGAGEDVTLTNDEGIQTQEFWSMRKKMAETEEELKEFKARGIELQQERMVAVNIGESLRSRIRELEKDVEERIKEKATFIQKSKDIEKKSQLILDIVRTKYSENPGGDRKRKECLIKQLVTLKTELKEVKEQNANLLMQHDLMLISSEKLKNEIVIKDSNVKDLEQKLDSLKHEFKKSKELNKHFHYQKKSTNEKGGLTAHEKEMHEAYQIIESKEEEIKILQDKLSSAPLEIHSLTEQSTILTAINSDLQKQLSSYNKRIEHLEQELVAAQKRKYYFF